jgi:hypothetical protein
MLGTCNHAPWSYLRVAVMVRCDVTHQHADPLLEIAAVRCCHGHGYRGVEHTLLQVSAHVIAVLDHENVVRARRVAQGQR